MPLITLNIKSQKATREVLSIKDLKDRYLFGLDIKKDGKALPDSVYDFYIQTAKKEVERFLSIKLDLQKYTETKSFYLDDWMHWSQIKATYSVVAPILVEGFVGDVKQVTYPVSWLKVRKTSDDETYSRLIHIVPTSGTTYQQTAAMFSGLYPNAASIAGGRNTPEYWSLQYITGFKQLPVDIEQAVGMLASLNVLIVANETIASAMGALGTSSKSISIDGLSQSVSMYVNGQAGIFGARIKQYSETLLGVGKNDGLLQRLKDFYGGIIWTTA